MCRGIKHCTELDKDPLKWDQYSPLTRPFWMSKEVDLFIDSVKSYLKQDRIKAVELIHSIRDQEITDWYIEHGQMSGMHRKNLLNLPEPQIVDIQNRDKCRSPKKYQNSVFKRDNYHCRYCGNKVISQEFLKLFSRTINLPHFKRGKTNLTTHGIFHLTWPVADHLIPWTNGGETTIENLVTSCAPCNYGKAGYTIEQIRINSPLNQPVSQSSWIGLSQHIQDLKNQ